MLAPTAICSPIFLTSGRRTGKAQRCVIPEDGFYEFTTAKDSKAKRKDKWLFTSRNSDLLAYEPI